MVSRVYSGFIIVVVSERVDAATPLQNALSLIFELRLVISIQGGRLYHRLYNYQFVCSYSFSSGFPLARAVHQ